MGMAISEWVQLQDLQRRVEALQARLEAAEGHLAAFPRREAPALHQASRFLERELQGGPLPFSEIVRRAADAGVPVRSLRRAKARLGVRSLRQPQRTGSRYITRWALP
jgi:hypothetical protein